MPGHPLRLTGELSFRSRAPGPAISKLQKEPNLAPTAGTAGVREDTYRQADYAAHDLMQDAALGQDYYPLRRLRAENGGLGPLTVAVAAAALVCGILL